MKKSELKKEKCKYFEDVLECKDPAANPIMSVSRPLTIAGLKMRSQKRTVSLKTILVSIFVVWLLPQVFLPQRAHAGDQFAIINILSNATSQCLDAYWSHGQSGEDVKLYHCDGTLEQEWILELVPYQTPSYNTGLIQIKNARYPQLCLDVKSSNYADRTPVWLYRCWSSNDERIKAQLFDMTHSFYNAEYFNNPDQYGRISLKKFFSSGDAMATWIRPFWGKEKVFDIAGGKTNGKLQLFRAHGNVQSGSPYQFKTNQIFTLILK